MKLYCEDESYKIYHGSMLDMLEVINKNSIDSIICDPPYELGFMGKSWDSSGIAFQKETWKKCFDVLKSGGFLLAFGGSRTFHRIACAIEDAGFEIRDCIMWLYGSGFPKSLNVGLAVDKKNGVESEVLGEREKTESWKYKNNNVFDDAGDKDKVIIQIKQAQNEWSGFGTSLKPAYEPVIVARKPVEKSITENVIKYGTGGINIDECRIYGDDSISCHNAEKGTFAGKVSTMPKLSKDNEGIFKGKNAERIVYVQHEGRFPSNVILTYDKNDYKEVCDGMLEGASRYFYCAKASKKDRDEGLDEFEEKQKMEYCLQYNNGEKRNEESFRKNIHPTVKPVELMQYLVRLVSPKGSIIMDCFLGSGSTGKAVMFENRERNANYKFIGIELTDEYLPIAQARINYAKYTFEYELKQAKVKKGQLNIFDFIEGE